MTKILMICVNYNSEPELFSFLKSINRQERSKIDITVAIVDNSQKEISSIEREINKYSWAKLFTPEKNLGYLGGAHYGANEIGIDLKEFNFVVFSNVDINLIGSEFLKKLTSLNLNDDCEAVAPKITSLGTGADLNPYLKERPSAKKTKLVKLFFKWYYLSIIYQTLSIAKSILKAKSSTPKTTLQEEIYAPHGSFIILTNSFFKKEGTLKFPCFLYGEEIFIAEQIKEHGGHVLYCPELEVSHTEHVSTGWIKSKLMAKYQYQALSWVHDTISKKNQTKFQ